MAMCINEEQICVFQVNTEEAWSRSVKKKKKKNRPAFTLVQQENQDTTFASLDWNKYFMSFIIEYAHYTSYSGEKALRFFCFFQPHVGAALSSYSGDWVSR